MKVLFLALSVLLAGAQAVPTKNVESRFIDGIIISVINDLIENIRDSGLDPLYVQKESIELSLPNSDLVNVVGEVEELLVVGLSNIVINNIDFSILALRLRYDISLPSIEAALGSASAKVVFGSLDTSADASGTLAIRQIRVTGQVRINIGISGVSIRDMTIALTVGDIDPALNIEVFGRDISDIVNYILGTVIPRILSDWSADINELLEYIILLILDRIL